MIAVDSSVAIAAFGEWHELNQATTEVLDGGVAIPSHALLETYSVLTGFPAPYRAAPDLVLTWLLDRFDIVLPAPSPEEHVALVGKLAGEGIRGGAAYDALVALTSRNAEATLVTADVRASRIYEAVEVEFRFIG